MNKKETSMRNINTENFNRENYKRAFSAFHTSEEFAARLNRELINEQNHGSASDMTKPSSSSSRSSRFRPAWLRPMLAAAGIILALMAGGTAAYAADLGGIQRKIQIWTQGELTDAVLTIDEQDGSYTVADADGTTLESGGGVAINADGSERPLTSDEIAEHLADQFDTETVDGHQYLLYKDQRIDITDAFTDSDVFYLTVNDGGDTLYVTVTKDDGIAWGKDRYLIPGADFSTQE